MIKYEVRMTTNTDNVESSLLILCNLVYVQFLLQIAHLQSCSVILLVELCPL